MPLPPTDDIITMSNTIGEHKIVNTGQPLQKRLVVNNYFKFFDIKRMYIYLTDLAIR